MEVPGFRPRFKFVSPLSGEAIAERIRAHLTTNNPRGLWMKDTHQHLLLNFQRRDSEAWTPQMDISFETQVDGRTLVRCLIGPVSTIWMLFAGGYLALSLLGLTGITLGIALHMLGHTPWGYYMVPFVLVGLGILIHLERTGRRRAHADMHYLKRFVDEALGCDCLKLSVEQGM
jgi:hypothetical protein